MPASGRYEGGRYAVSRFNSSRFTRAQGGGGFSPASLFANGEDGVWLDPSDTSTVFQDAAGTTPAGDGDPVGRIEDKSGNGHHATQSTAAARPVLRQTGGGLYYLEFDGIDDGMRTADGVLNTASVTFSAALKNTKNQSNCFGFPHSSISHTRPFFRFMLFRSNSGLSEVRLNGINQESNEPFPSGNSVFTLSNKVGSLRIDGTQVETISTDDITYPNSVPLLVGQNAEGDEAADMDFYGFVAIDRQLVSSEINNLENYLADKSGVTL